MQMQISCKCKFNCDGKKCNSNPIGIRINVRLSAKIQKKNTMYAQKIFGILLHVTKTVSTKKYFKKFLYFARLFINYHDIIDSC